MSEFMKSVVEDVLRRSSPKNTTPHTSKQTASTHEKDANIVNTKNKRTDNVLQGLQRPNYQREKQKERLNVLKKRTNTAGKQTTHQQKPMNNNRFTSDENLSKLTIASYADEKVTQKTQPKRVISRGVPAKETEAQFIGKTKNNTSVWFFSQVHEQMESLFKGDVKTNPVGVVMAERCYPGQLFVVDEILKENSELKYHLEWDGSSRENFILEIYIQDEKCMLQILNKIYQRLNRHTIIQIESYTALHPSAWLLQKLKLDATHSCLGVLEGNNYYDNIGLLDRYLKNNPDANFTYKIEESYFSIMGDSQEISTAIQAMKKEANRYLITR